MTLLYFIRFLSKWASITTVNMETTQRMARSSPAAAPINTHHDKKSLLNHGHPYTDVIVDTVILDSKTLDDVWERKADGGGGGEKVTYWSLVKGNEKFRWYLMSYLVTHAGE